MAEVRATVEAKWEALLECLRTTPACDVSTVADYYTGVALPGRLETINGYNAEGTSFRNVDQYRIAILSVSFYDNNFTAVVRVCVDDRSVQVRAGANPDGSDVIVDDDRVSSILDWEMVKGEDARWRQAFGDTIEQSVNGEPVCVIDA